jgi:retinol dehydrogenase 12
MTWFTSFLYRQFFVSIPKPHKDFTGQTIIVTGSNVGLGLEAARHISRLGAELLILAVRTKSKGEAAKKSILETTNRSPESIEVWELDLGSYASVKTFAERASKLPRIDGLLENAGIMTDDFRLLEGHESVITVNVFSTFLLAFLMLPKLRETAQKYNVQPHLTIVASDVHFIAKFREQDSQNIFAALDDKSKATLGFERYSTSKLLEVLVVREMASITRKNSNNTPVIFNCLTPGACKSELSREASGFAALMMTLLSNIIARTTEVGGRTLVAGLEAGENSHGSYMADSKVEK